ncbi:Nibrin [Lasius niger]|uniref:Nibrin n=1 Tax=Lasius niger TaxID=67767 RepID=A0A0J7MW08_LASNI|nr:Nibrin [Lasius niger]
MYCNPKFDFATFVKLKTQIFSPSDMIIVEDTQEVDNAAKKQIKRNTIPETCDSQNNIVSTKMYFTDESEQREESVNNIFSDKSNNKQAHIIFDTCKFKNILSNVTMEKEETDELQEKEVFVENNSILAKNNKKKDILEENKYKFQQLGNMFINKDSSTSENSNLNCKENLIVENDSLNDNTDKFENARWERSRNSEYPRILSIEEIDNNEMYIQRGKEKNILGKYCFTDQQSQNSLKESKLGSVCKSERNQENKKVKGNEIQKRDKRKEEPQRTGANWYERYLNQEFTNEILRKDIPCGKRFTKKPIMILEKILKVDDFVL